MKNLYTQYLEPFLIRSMRAKLDLALNPQQSRTERNLLRIKNLIDLNFVEVIDPYFTVKLLVGNKDSHNDTVKISFKDMKHAMHLSSVIRKRSKKSANLVRSTFLKSLLGMPARFEYRMTHGFVLRNITFSPTYWCNLNCQDKCYPDSSRNDAKVLDDEVVRKVIDETRRTWSNQFFTATGGESLFQAIKYAEKNPKVLFSLFTNATLIREDVAEKIASLRNLFPLVSIEGPREETDRIRGEGIYDKTMKTMELLRDKGVVYGVSFTLTKRNAYVWDDDIFIDTLIDKGAFFGRFLTYMPAGRDADFEMVPTEEQRRKQGEALGRINREKTFHALDYLNNPEALSGCGAGGLRYIHVDPYADVYPCVFIPVPALFNLKEAYNGTYEEAGIGINCLEDILLEDPFLQVIRDKANAMNVNHCCPIIDDTIGLREVCKDLAENYPSDISEAFLKLPGGEQRLNNYLKKLVKFSEPTPFEVERVSA